MFHPLDVAPSPGLLKHHGSSPSSSLPPEIEEGNIEYKLKLINVTPDRFEHLITQMKWRLAEGNGEAIYEIGIADNGRMVGLTPSELSHSLSALHAMAGQLCADCSILRKQSVAPATSEEEERVAVEVLVRKKPKEEHFLEVRVAMLGASDAGKSTLLSVLAYSELDNGYGKARSRSFNHKHEVTSGKTSSLREEVLGFDSSGHLLNYATCGIVTPQDIVERASKIITLVDFPGLLKYLPTTITGITGCPPDYAMLVINPSNVTDSTREYLGMLMVLNIPFFIVVTKVDVTPGQIIKDALGSLVAGFKSAGRPCVPKIVRNDNDIITMLPEIASGTTVPIFLVSSVSGSNLSLLSTLFNLAPHSTRVARGSRGDGQDAVQFQVHDVYDVPNVGVVLGGHLIQGTLQLNRNGDTKSPSSYSLGPFPNGEFKEIYVHGIHRLCRPVTSVSAGHCATLAIQFPSSSSPMDASVIRRGMTLVSSGSTPAAYWEFEAQLHVLHHASSLSFSQTALVFCGSVRQPAKVIWLEKPSMRSGERARVRFRFLNGPEWLKPGMLMLARDGRIGQMKCVGTILKVDPKEAGNHFLATPPPSPPIEDS